MSAGEQFTVLANEYLDDLARRHPDIATELGDHRFDDRLAQRGEPAAADERRALDTFASRLAALDVAALGPESALDAAMLAEHVALRVFELDELREHAINAILDARVHAHGMTEAEAMALMTGRGFQEEGEAAGKWRRARLTSAQLSTYYVGYTEIADLARELLAEPGATERAVHDRARGARPDARPRQPPGRPAAHGHLNGPPIEMIVEMGAITPHSTIIYSS